MANESPRRFAVVTGASSGIGFELARECIERDYDVLMCAEDAVIHTAAKHLAGRRAKPEALQADLATQDGVDKLHQAIVVTGRPVDLLILNAGVGVGGAFVDTALDAEVNMVMLNCLHTIRLAKLVLPAMVSRGEGRVAITGSVVSTAPNPYQAVYAATKAFVMSFGEAIRNELADTGVTVTVIQPGATDTNFFKRAHLLDTKVGQGKKDPPELVAKNAFEAILDGKDSVLAGGFKSKVEGLMNEILPETFKAAQTGKTTKPLSKS